jgi:hypothetical protein
LQASILDKIQSGAMFTSQLLVLLIGLSFHSFVSCDYYKNELQPLQSWLSDESTKYDRVQIQNKNVPKITRDLFTGVGPVRKMEIEGCNVTSIAPSAFRSLRYLQKLSLRHNLLETIKKDVFSHLEIEELDLRDNHIRRIDPDAFVAMPKLQELCLKDNKIAVYNRDWFRSLPSLVWLNLENNFIKSLPSGILPKSVGTFPFSVILSHNRIENIDENAFGSGLSFNRLYLDHNSISTIANKTFAGVEIMDLRLNHNVIVCMTPDVRGVKLCDVSGNPWDEECLLNFRKTSYSTAVLAFGTHRLSN